MEHIIERIRAICPISDNTARTLSELCTPCTFAKRHRLIEEGKRAQAAYFIASGLTRSFWIVDGEEITTSFSPIGSIVFSMDEIYFGKASQEYVEAIEKVEAYRIDAHALRRLVTENVELAVWWSRIHELEYRRIHQSHKERLTLSARDRYEAFRRQFPDICRRVPRKFIASYLGMDLATLSRQSKNLT